MQQDEAAARAGLSVATVRRYASSGVVVPRVQDARDAPLYTTEDLVRLIRARHVGSLVAPKLVELRRILAVLEALDDPTRTSARGALFEMLERMMRAAKTCTTDASTAWVSSAQLVAEASIDVSRQIPWVR